jgi:hypothetical protein
MDIHGHSLEKLHTLSLIELKKLGKQCGLYKYHTLSKNDLLKKLSNDTMPFEEKFKKVTKKQLIQFAKEQNIKVNPNEKVSILKDQLEEIYMCMLYPEITPQKKNEDDKNTEKHDCPQKKDTQ